MPSWSVDVNLNHLNGLRDLSMVMSAYFSKIIFKMTLIA
ncbi:hypothetical protein AO378_0423 [Moraxella catarrhalis]|nr:hypothetical protein AO378_0423 [Moraxella catarrhalis]